LAFNSWILRKSMLYRITGKLQTRITSFLALLTSGSTQNLNKMQVAYAADKNKDPIKDVLQKYLPAADTKGQVVEIASGTGQHISHFADGNTHITWQPTDMEKEHRESIAAYTATRGLTHVLPPLPVDITEPISSHPSLTPGVWDLMYNSNMVHISPWDTAVGLFKAAGILLKPSSGVLMMYGPFRIHGVLTPESNVKFDRDYLKAKDPRFGVRDIDDLEKLAVENNLKFETMIDMPANNKCLIFRKGS